MDDFEYELQRLKLEMAQNEIVEIKNAIKQHKENCEKEEEYSEINKKLWEVLE